jgi:GMP synthase-like glutamine amidotransferase
MRLLLSQQEVKKPPFFFVHDALERAWHIFLSGHDITAWPNLPNRVPDLDAFDALVLTGGNDSIARHITEDNLFRLFDEANKIIIGFCHGALVINDVAGGINSEIHGHLGSEHTVIMQDHLFTVNSYHGQCVQKLAPGYQVIATDEQGHAECFRHVFKPHWAVLWHPERQAHPVLPTELAALLHNEQSPWKP